MADFEKAYDKAVSDGILPGYALIAGDAKGNILYSKAAGVASLKEGAPNPPFKLDTICAIASMTKLMTAVAVLQVVQDGLTTLDEDVSKHLPTIGKYGIMTPPSNETSPPTFTPNPTPITLRMLLAHTNGHEYDWFSPQLMAWRASRGETPWCGPTVEEKSTVPLLYEPGTSWRYGHGTDWAGKVVEKVSNQSLDAFMRARIWDPLDITDATFYPAQRPEMQGRMATISKLSEACEGPATDASSFDVLFGATDCLGGGGAFASAEAYFTFLQAVLRRDARLLSGASWDELLRPQLDDRCKREFQAYIASSPLHTQYLGMSLPADVDKTWCFAGMRCETGQEGRMEAGSVTWGGVPSMTWYLDFEKQVCGVAFCQVIPAMSPPILKLHEQFQREIYQRVEASRDS